MNCTDIFINALVSECFERSKLSLKVLVLKRLQILFFGSIFVVNILLPTYLFEFLSKKGKDFSFQKRMSGIINKERRVCDSKRPYSPLRRPNYSTNLCSGVPLRFSTDWVQNFMPFIKGNQNS